MLKGRVREVRRPLSGSGVAIYTRARSVCRCTHHCTEHSDDILNVGTHNSSSGAIRPHVLLENHNATTASESGCVGYIHVHRT